MSCSTRLREGNHNFREGRKGFLRWIVLSIYGTHLMTYMIAHDWII